MNDTKDNGKAEKPTVDTTKPIVIDLIFKWAPANPGNSIKIVKEPLEKESE